MKIWKYEISSVGEMGRIEFDIPQGAKFLNVNVQHIKPVMWFLITSESKMEKRKFQIIITGQDFAIPPSQYICTFQLLQLNGQYFVGHIFEITC